jgi:hemerythrin-like domain-containing protein
MKPSDILSGEHRVIELVLNCLEKISEACLRDDRLDEMSAREAIDFFRNFADRCHHGKEEAHFFPAMEAKGFSRESGPTGVMLREHELGREYIRGMDDAVDEASSGDRSACSKFIANAQNYLDLLREHIEKEDHCLFSMADQAFDEEDQQKLLAAFARVESEEIGDGTHEKYLAIANELAQRFGVAELDAAAVGRLSCGCGH